MNLTNKVAIVTGGASGLGEGTVRNLVAHGAKVLMMVLTWTEGKPSLQN